MWAIAATRLRSAAISTTFPRVPEHARPSRDPATINYPGAQFPSPFYGLIRCSPAARFRAADVAALSAIRQRHLSRSGRATPGFTRCSRAEKRMAQGSPSRCRTPGRRPWTPRRSSTPRIRCRTNRSASSIARTASRAAVFGSFPSARAASSDRKCRKSLDFFAGGWQLSGALQRQSGQPIGWGQMIITGAPQIALPSDQRNADRWFNTAIFDNRSADQLASNIRTFPLRFSNVRFDSQRRKIFPEQDIPVPRAVQDAVPGRFVQHPERARTSRTEHDRDQFGLRHDHRSGVAANVPALIEPAVLIGSDRVNPRESEGSAFPASSPACGLNWPGVVVGIQG